MSNGSSSPGSTASRRRERSCTRSSAGKNRREAARSRQSSLRTSTAPFTSSPRSVTMSWAGGHAAHTSEAQRRAFTYVDSDGERTITVLGRKLIPSGEDGSLPWEELGRCEAVYVVSGEDAGERFEPGELEPPPRYVVTTSGSLGGWVRPGGPFRAVSPPGPVQDAYGCGDCFAAGLTYALAEGRTMEDAVALGARCGAAVLTGRGPYDGQLVAGPSGPPTRFDQSS